ncbi:MAG: hypothetical protein HW385_1333 [candidate division NC10 bacterium]|nr:hypothetical protein [candidate division NC10 bacterium]
MSEQLCHLVIGAPAKELDGRASHAPQATALLPVAHDDHASPETVKGRHC